MKRGGGLTSLAVSNQQMKLCFTIMPAASHAPIDNERETGVLVTTWDYRLAPVGIETSVLP